MSTYTAPQVNTGCLPSCHTKEENHASHYRYKRNEQQSGGRLESPGTVDTPVFDKMGFTDTEVLNIKPGFKDIIPMSRAGSPEEMGGVAVFLASSDSPFVVGEEIVADGGVVNL